MFYYIGVHNCVTASVSQLDLVGIEQGGVQWALLMRADNCYKKRRFTKRVEV